MTTEARADRELGVMISKMQRRRMTPQSPRVRWSHTRILLPLTEPAHAQVIPFQGTFGPGLSPDDNRLLFESVARSMGAVPSQVGRSEAWSNPQTKSHGASTILQVFHSGGMTPPSDAPSHRGGKATGSRLPPHLVSHV